ncbi:hypothetical protein RRG08_025068 [Elysia crispata]|uniref:Uncharacterized protein n=1 Tax=Elysia crispata TaxID=231223 RepID=A0AAE1DZ58_9GAST|nr:hypothetical protein RRG08_025068 [Elysia crispata]
MMKTAISLKAEDECRGCRSRKLMSRVLTLGMCVEQSGQYSHSRTANHKKFPLVYIQLVFIVSTYFQTVRNNNINTYTPRLHTEEGLTTLITKSPCHTAETFHAVGT